MRQQNQTTSKTKANTQKFDKAQKPKKTTTNRIEMKTYTVETDMDNFDKEINTIVKLFDAAVEIFGQEFKGGVKVASEKILDTMKQKYHKELYWSCNLKSKSAQIITNKNIGFGWREVAKTGKVIISIFIVGNNEEYETLLKTSGYKIQEKK